MLRTIYIFLIALYLMMFAAYFLKYEISYRIMKVRPEIVEERSLTYEEHKNLKKATEIRYRINLWMLISSVIICVVSAGAWYFNFFTHKTKYKMQI